MALPQPLVSLRGGCTVVFDNTLYAYTARGFQSLELAEGAEWKKLPSGTSVEGGVCVGSTPKDTAAAGLYIVGGKSRHADYAGLQKFTYSTGKWESITPEVPVTKDRVYHSATYLNSTGSLLVYSGSTEGTPAFSQQTFTIDTSIPYSVLAYQSDLAPAGTAPILLPWSETQAALIGGNPWNTKIVLFDTAANNDGINGGWVDSGITLAEPLPKNTTLVKAAIIQGDDQSRHLYTFDLSTSPNTVNRTMLLDSRGAPIPLAAPAETTSTDEEEVVELAAPLGERALLANEWPPYNSTFAPTSARTDYSIATSPDGLVVLSGGDADDVLCMFNAKANTWKDTKAVFGTESISTQSTHTTASASSSKATTATTSPTTATTSAITSAITSAETSAAGSTATPASTHAPVPVTPTSTKQFGLPPTTILGIILGSLFGSAIILAILLLLVRRRQQRRSFIEVGHARRASGLPDGKDYFRDDLAQASGGHFRGHTQQNSQNSFSSIGMFLGRSQKSAVQRKGSNEKTRASGDSVYSKDLKNMISRPQQPVTTTQPSFLAQGEKIVLPPEPVQAKPRTRTTANRESDMRRSSGWNRYWSGGSASILGLGSNGSKSRRDTEVSEASSQYSDMHRMTQDSATVPPLRVEAEGRPSFHHVASGSPTVSQYDARLGQGQSGLIVERPVSAVSAVSAASAASGVSAVSSSGYSSGIPPSVHEAWDSTPNKPWGSERAPNSAYTNNTAGEPWYPTALGAPTTNRPRVGISQQPPLAVASVSNDMSWLNLGDNDRDNDRSANDGRSYR
ncbi:hypothetical protein GGS20DRAFT_481013 [Poronia punctata]|nr:hypothetical protein GGS20DRAFT_481013 [Poronia punctata]